MQPGYWHQKWKTNDIRFHQDQPHPQLLTHGKLLPPGPVMVPLCGKSKDMLWLRAAGHEVVGIELSSIACEAFFEENRISFTRQQTKGGTLIFSGDGFKIWCGDFFEIPKDAWVGCASIYDRAALIALPADVRKKYASHISSSWQKSEGILLLIAIEHEGVNVVGPPFSVSENEIHSLYESHFTINRLDALRDPSLSGVAPKFTNVEVIEKIYLLNRQVGVKSS